jgi:hypothetical protein
MADIIKKEVLANEISELSDAGTEYKIDNEIIILQVEKN